MSRRIQRLTSRIHFLVTSVIQRELSDPRIGMITILRVELASDLREAKVYFSVLGSRGDISKTCHAIDQATGFIQREVARNLETRNTPQMTFVLDDSLDRRSRIEALMEKVNRDDDGADDRLTGEEN